LAKAVFDLLTLGAAAVAANRAACCKKWIARAFELKQLEAELHGRLEPVQRTVLRGKRLLVMEEMLIEAGHQDKDLVKQLIAGALLTGPSPPSNIYAKKKPVEARPCETLRKQAVWMQAAVLGRCKPSISQPEAACVDMDSEVWAETVAELDRGWLSGPFLTKGDVSESVGEEAWIPSLRFGILQGERSES